MVGMVMMITIMVSVTVRVGTAYRKIFKLIYILIASLGLRPKVEHVTFLTLSFAVFSLSI